MKKKSTAGMDLLRTASALQTPAVDDVGVVLGAGINRTLASPAHLRRVAHQARTRSAYRSLGPVSALRLRDIMIVHPADVSRVVDARLVSAVENGTACYIEGAAPGVGLTPLLIDYANGFNLLAGQVGDPRRIAHLQIAPRTTSITKFLGALGHQLRSPISTTELRFRDAGELGRRVLGAAKLAGVSTLIIDGITNASEAIREAIGFLALVADPRYTVIWDADELDGLGWRMGVVIAGSSPPEEVFQNYPDVLLALDGGTLTFPPLTTGQHVAEVMRQADIGLDDLDLEESRDLELVTRVFQVTDGLVARLVPLLQVMDLVTRTSGISRPNLECVEAAMRVVPKLVRRVATAHSYMPGELVHSVLVRPAPKRPPQQADSKEQHSGKTLRSHRLREKRETQENARAEGKKMRGRSKRG